MSRLRRRIVAKNGISITRQGDLFSQLKVDGAAEIVDSGVENVTIQLFTRGFVGEDGFLIGTWKFNPTENEWQLVGNLRLDRVTPSAWGRVAERGGEHGPELHTTSNAAADPNGTEADATAGWVPNAASLASIPDPHTGGFAIEVSKSGGGGSNFAALVFAIEVGADYRIQWYAKRGATGIDQKFTQWTGFVVTTTPITTASFKRFLFNLAATLTGSGIIRCYASVDGLGSPVAVFDNVSVRKILAGNTAILVSDALLSVDDFILWWSPSRGVVVATGRKITDKTAGVITFDGPPVTLRDDDIAIKEGVEEFTFNTDFKPQLGAIAYFLAGGLYCEGDNCRLPMVGIKGATSLRIRSKSLFNDTADVEPNEFGGVGWLHDGATQFAGPVIARSGDYNKGVVRQIGAVKQLSLGLDDGTPVDPDAPLTIDTTVRVSRVAGQAVVLTETEHSASLNNPPMFLTATELLDTSTDEVVVILGHTIANNPTLPGRLTLTVGEIEVMR